MSTVLRVHNKDYNRNVLEVERIMLKMSTYHE